MSSKRTFSWFGQTALSVVTATVMLVQIVLPATAFADARTEARRHFRHGMELVVQGQTDAGVAELQQAYDILPHPNVLYNIGRAYAEAGRYEEALDFFEQYLASDPPDREEVRGIVTAINARMAAREATAAEQRAEAQTQQTPVEGTQTPASTGPALRATASEIQALRDAATQIATLGEVSQSDTLRQRAVRLTELADQLEQQSTASTATTTTATATQTVPNPTNGTTQQAGQTAPEGALTVAAQGSGAAAAGGGAYEETVVTSSRYAQSPLDAASSTTIITRQDIHMSGLTQIGELLRRVAGVQVVNTTGADIDVGIRGFNRLLSPRVVMLINGRSTYLDALGITLWGVQPIDVDDIERIEVIRGPASALYGANSFSGIVNIITRDPGERPSNELAIGGGNGGQVRMHAASNGRIGNNLTYRINGGYQQLERFALPFSTDRVDISYPAGIDPKWAAKTMHARADFRYRINPRTQLNFEGGVVQAEQFTIRGTGGFNNLYANGPNAYAQASLASPWGGIRSSYFYYDYTAAEADQSTKAFRVAGNTADVEAELARAFHWLVDHNLHLGAGYRYKQVQFGLLEKANLSQNTWAIFFEDTLKFSDAVRFAVSVRTDANPLLPHPITSPRGALIIRPTQGQSIRFSGTSAFRIPSFTEGYLQATIPTPVASSVGVVGFGSIPAHNGFGFPVVKPERIATAEIGYINQESDYYNFELSAYYNRVWDLMELGNQTQPFTLGAYANPALAGVAGYNQGTNQFTYGTGLLTNSPYQYNVYGGEAMVRVYPIDGLDIWANYAFNLNMYANGQGPLANTTRDLRQPAHMVNAGVQYRAPFGLDVAFDVHFNSKVIWPELVTTTDGIVYQPFASPAYYMVNGRVGYRFWNDRLEVGVAGYNITNNKFRQHPLSSVTPTRVMATFGARF